MTEIAINMELNESNQIMQKDNTKKIIKLAKITPIKLEVSIY